MGRPIVRVESDKGGTYFTVTWKIRDKREEWELFHVNFGNTWKEDLFRVNMENM